MKFAFVTFQIGILLLLCSCSKPPSVSSSLSPADEQALNASFERLQKALEAKVPSISTNLAPPATDAEIQQLRATLNGSKIEVLEAWFRWHNGASRENIGLLPLGDPLSIARALEDRKMMQSIPLVDELRKNSIKIMDDGAGDGFFLDVTSAHPTVFYHMLEDPVPRPYGTMSQFVDFIASGFEAGVLFVDARGFLSYDPKTYEAFEKAYFASIGQP